MNTKACLVLANGQIFEGNSFGASGVIVGEAEQTDLEICETLFTIFNFRKPEDFKGHSLSVSDVIELTRNGRTKFYYCDTYGFTEVLVNKNNK